MNTITEELVSQQLLSTAEAHAAEAAAAEQRQSLVSWLLEKELCAEAELACCLANHFRLPLLAVDALAIQRSPLELIDEKIMRKFQCLPLSSRGNTLYLAVADPCRPDLLADVKFHTGKQIELVIVQFQPLLTLLAEVLRENDDSRYVDRALHEEAILGSNTPKQSEVDAAGLDDKPLVRFVNRLLADAIRNKVSDIHFEPYEKFYRVRFRRDGQLYEVVRPPLNMSGRLAARLKVMAQLDISERRIPQDGRIRWRTSGAESIDFRVSVLPTLWGEKLVLRNLDTSHRLLELDGMGMQEWQLQQFTAALGRSQGLILVTGPTGSGKTQTLYTGIQQLNRAERNIATAEDPVEFTIDGVNQVPVNEKNGLSFARILRAFLRQDPDVLMVGEIRDRETAEIAIKAAQTGHLVLATLHTNDALGALDRLQNMGIAPYNLASAATLLIAQRLLRRLCEYCKEPLHLPRDTLMEQGFSADEIQELTLFQADGCEQCHGGYRGRIGIYEVVPVSSELARRIMSGEHSKDLAAFLKSNSHIDMRRAALLKAKQGISSLEEANRLT